MKSKHPHPPAESGKESATPDAKSQSETTAPGVDPAEQSAAEIASLKDQLLRARADFENSRKRLMREKEDSLRYANQGILADLLPLLDHLELGLQAASAGTDVASVVAGVKLIQSQFERFLTEHGVTPIEALGKPFDPNWHEALGQEPAPGKPEGTVLHLRRRGFKLGDRLLRPASVVTVAPPSA
jgi:molecular chaperone GrpE